MLTTVSTVRDTRANIEKFVARNLAGGVDHLFVVLDEPTGEVVEFLDDHPHTTAISTDDEWWRGRRPDQLGRRQKMNANLVKSVLSRLGWAEWLFHIDGDEALRVDRAELAALPPEVEFLRAMPLEAVSRSEPVASPTTFKRLLNKDELALLVTLGLIQKQANHYYFHGHVNGKSGMRLHTDRWHGVHAVWDDDRETQDAPEPAWLRLLHFESHSMEEFVRKWRALLSSGQRAGFRAARASTARSFAAIQDSDMAPEVAEKYLRRIFELTVLDDVDTLSELGLLVELDPLEPAGSPQPVPEADLAATRAVFDRLHTAPKVPFLLQNGVERPRRIVDKAVAQVIGRRQGRA